MDAGWVFPVHNKDTVTFLKLARIRRLFGIPKFSSSYARSINGC
jgi:hypothetical protein